MKSWIELSQTRLIANVHATRAATKPDVLLLFVVKANAYGHDAAIVAEAIHGGAPTWFGVTDVEEGIRVRKALDPADDRSHKLMGKVRSPLPLMADRRSRLVFQNGARILVMCGIEPTDIPALIQHDLTPVVWTLQQIKAIEEEAAKRLPGRVVVHLEIDTGMSRQGVAPGPELEALLAHLAASEHVLCEGVMTHFACAESGIGSPGAAVTAAQQQRFSTAAAQILAAGVMPRYIHVGNTSTVDEGSTVPWLIEIASTFRAKPMVRIGIGLYGDSLPLEGDSTPQLHPQLQPVLTWKTRILDLRDIPAGATIGYGATFTAPAPMRLALLPVGYADGFRREASSGIGNGWVMIAGHKAKVVGRVSMNLTVVDVTALPAAIGDEVVLLGEGVSATDHARWCGTIPYEILCGIRSPLRPISWLTFPDKPL